MAGEREVILPFPSPVVPARNVRSTLILSSFATVRDAGFEQTYLSVLPVEAREYVQNAVVGMWIPMSIAMAHYSALEGLGLSVDQQVANGRVTFDRTAGTLLGTAVKLSKNAGVTPWTVFPYFQRFWLRGLDGGGIQVSRLGPKDALLEAVQIPVLDVRYFRNALRGLVMSICDMFCAKSYAKEVAVHRTPESMAVRVQWA